MRKFIYTIAFAFISCVGTQAQINLIGASTAGSSGISLVRWQALDASSVTTTPTLLDGYVYATSGFDPYNSNYYIAGISGQNSGLYAYNTTTATESLMSGSLYTNVSEFDMSTGKMYNLIMQTPEYINIYEYDIQSNQDSLIGTIYEPGANGIVTEAISFDSN